jgi:hypothetical protein
MGLLMPTDDARNEFHLSVAESVARSNVAETWILLDTLGYAADLLTTEQLVELTDHVNRFATED